MPPVSVSRKLGRRASPLQEGEDGERSEAGAGAQLVPHH
jgi:hypothetical protein